MMQPCSLFQPIAEQPCASLGSSLGALYLHCILSVLFVNKLFKKFSRDTITREEKTSFSILTTFYIEADWTLSLYSANDVPVH
jgi:hypothetical protein